MNTLSSKNLNLLPNPKELKQLCKSISTLEAILSPEWEYRFYSYQKDWSATEEFCEMRDGEGNQLLIVFKSNGTALNGFAHESQMIDQKEILSKIPMEFNDFIFEEPVKSIGSSFCIWQTKSDTYWQIGDIQYSNNSYYDGSEELLKLLDGKAMTYKVWADEYYEIELDLKLVEEIFQGNIITKDIVTKINPELNDFEKLKSDLQEIGYQYEI